MAERKDPEGACENEARGAVRAAQGSFEKHPPETRRPDRAGLHRCSSLWASRPAQDLDAIEGIIAEGEEIMDEFKDTSDLMPPDFRCPGCRALRDGPLRHV